MALHAVHRAGPVFGRRVLVTGAGPIGCLVMLGTLPAGAVAFPANLVVTRELDVRGAFRFDTEFAEALRLLAAGLPVGPLVTGVVPLAAAADGFALAADRRRSVKILLDLTG